MNKSTYPIFGLREISRPKGDGYLYLSIPGEFEGRPLAHFDLYKTSDEQFREILKNILPTVLSGCRSEYLGLVNFKPFAADIFRDVASGFSDAQIVLSDKN